MPPAASGRRIGIVNGDCETLRAGRRILPRERRRNVAARAAEALVDLCVSDPGVGLDLGAFSANLSCRQQHREQQRGPAAMARRRMEPRDGSSRLPFATCAHGFPRRRSSRAGIMPSCRAAADPLPEPHSHRRRHQTRRCSQTSRTSRWASKRAVRNSTSARCSDAARGASSSRRRTGLGAVQGFKRRSRASFELIGSRTCAVGELRTSDGRRRPRPLLHEVPSTRSSSSAAPDFSRLSSSARTQSLSSVSA